MTMLTKQQEERLKEKFTNPEYVAWNGLMQLTTQQAEAVEQHLAEELSLQLSKIIQIAEGMKEHSLGTRDMLGEQITDYDKGEQVGRNQALSDLISKLTTLKEGK